VGNRIQYRDGYVAQESSGTFSASYLNDLLDVAYQALAGQGYGFPNIEAAQSAIDEAIDWRERERAVPTVPTASEYVEPIFAIGGLNRGDGAETPSPWPAEGRCCQRCGSYESDGAMFTTIASGNVCDDCL